MYFSELKQSPPETMALAITVSWFQHSPKLRRLLLGWYMTPKGNR